jgi:hypothetical protein
LRQGMTDAQSAAMLGWTAPALMFVTALPLFLGLCAFGIGVWRATDVYRREWLSQWRDVFATYSGPLPERVKRIPVIYILLMEVVGGIFGFPGLGWLYAGQALVGIALLCVGPAIAWALIPLLTSPFADTPFQPYGITVLFAWLVGSTMLSALLLAGYLRLKRGVVRKRDDKFAPTANASPARPTE